MTLAGSRGGWTRGGWQINVYSDEMPLAKDKQKQVPPTNHYQQQPPSPHSSG